MRMPRRDFLRAAAAMSVSPALAPPLAASETQPNTDSTPVRWAGYDDAIVIDFLGSPGYFNYPENPPLDAAMIENARTSGITAMNVTVNGGDFESTIRRMSPWLSNVDRYPETFRQVRTVEQLMDAKATGRVGIVLGFQDTTPFGTDLSTMDVFYEMGVRVVQLTYNVRNMVGDGCLEPGNAGLSSF
ncbi:MAG: hypothetical protein HN463_15945, partial [Gemmatimonadales bacterium]|nr:hypothetical protein [Gemmatimonadales bacterium]